MSWRHRSEHRVFLDLLSRSKSRAYYERRIGSPKNCFYCRREIFPNLRSGGGHNLPETATVDHVLPRSMGGTNDAKNLRWACHGCNALRNRIVFLPENERWEAIRGVVFFLKRRKLSMPPEFLVGLFEFPERGSSPPCWE